MFTSTQIEQILSVLDRHFLFTISTSMGTDVLSREDEMSLVKHGFNLKSMEKSSLYDKMFLLGRLTSVLSDSQVAQLDFSDFLQYVNTGQYIPLSKSEKFQLDIAKRKSYTHLKGLKEKAKNQFESVLLENETSYDRVVKEGMIEGVAKRKSLQSIVSDLGHKMNNWGHDWGRIVDTEMNNIFQEGRAATMMEDADDPDPLVYKHVYEGACRHCIKAYLTKGIGSRPKLFKLSELIANGTNIGRKVANWLATLGGMHPFCRCHLYKVKKGYEWNEETNKFEIPKKYERKVERKSKIGITVGKKHFKV